MHLNIQRGVFVGFLALLHVKKELNNIFSFDFFSVLQIELIKTSPYAFVVQILE
jgi:hypothetical protein